MILVNPATLLLAAAVSSPALYQAFVTDEMDPTTAMFRYLLAVPVCGVMMAILNGLTADYRTKQLEARHAERVAAQAEARSLDARHPDATPVDEPADFEDENAQAA
jgi:hypothetical protein